MRTFDGNLTAYHALNTSNDIYSQSIKERLARASTKEEMQAILQENFTHFAEQTELYKELGEEMVKIMDVKWWQFWK